MALTLTTPNTVLGALSPKSAGARVATQIATVVLGTLVLWASAKISVPVMPIPVSLQTMAVAGLAAAFGWRIGVATLMLYLVEGLAGLPVFAYGGGIQYLTSPSFGFLLGYIPMAYIIGKAADQGAGKKLMTLFGAMLIGDAVLFAFGFAWLLAVSTIIVQAGAALPSWIDAGNLLGSAFKNAVEPFILWDIVKMAFAALTVTSVWQLARRKA
jgi:biotin transport system substrate-specific component